MGALADIVRFSASKLAETGAALWEAYVPVGDDDTDVEPFGAIEVFQSLGVSSRPWRKDANGFVEGVVLRHCGGKTAVCIGARDTRTAKIVGNLAEGDTVVHSTGPQQAAQLQLKEAKRQAVLASKDTRGKSMALVLDGKNDKFQIVVFGHIFEMTRETISLVHRNGHGIVLSPSGVHTLGTTTLGGLTPVAPVVGCTPPATPPPGGVAVPGVYYGA